MYPSQFQPEPPRMTPWYCVCLIVSLEDCLCYMQTKVCPSFWLNQLHESLTHLFGVCWHTRALFPTCVGFSASCEQRAAGKQPLGSSGCGFVYVRVCVGEAHASFTGCLLPRQQPLYRTRTQPHPWLASRCCKAYPPDPPCHRSCGSRSCMLDEGRATED